MNEWLKEVSGWLVAIAAGAAALGWLLRKTWKAFKKLDRLIELAELVEKEMRPNGGGSLRDAVNATRAEVGAVRHELAEHKAEHARNPVTVNVGQVPNPTP